MLNQEFQPHNINDTHNLSDLVNQFNNELQRVLNTVAPEKKMNISVRSNQPWYNNDVKRQHIVVRNREGAWTNYKLLSLWKAFKHERNINIRLPPFKKRQVYSKMVKDSKGYTKKLYKIVNELTGSKMENPMPPSDSNESSANHFADFFITKIDKIMERFTGTDAHSPPVSEGVLQLRKFSVLTEQEVAKIVSSLQTKSCELDPIPTKLFKEMLPTILPYLTKIINLSFDTGAFCEV